MHTLGVAIVGCGAIGAKRAHALASFVAPREEHDSARLVVCADVALPRAEKLAEAYAVTATGDWEEAVLRDDVHIVVVATTNDGLAQITRTAAVAGKHVLVEKPAARSVEELSPVIQAAKRNGVFVRVGFNHRYHPALRRARQFVDAGAVGDLMFVRGRYGHGGRRGYAEEWRADPARAGGGELIDQGIHLIDLARWFLGEFSDVSGFAHTYYWNMPTEDNAFLLLKTKRQQAALLHSSCTEWKNLFSFEIFGRGGKLHAEGLGGSYGIERLTLYKTLPEMGPPETTIWEYPRGDDSFAVEFGEFLEDIRLDRSPAVNLDDARAALEIVEKVYIESGLKIFRQ